MPSYLVVTPSRGLIHSRTVEAVQANVSQAWFALRPKVSSWWIVSHDLPIPEAHNDVAARALKHAPDYLWFVEEDMVPPAGALQRLHEELQRHRAAMAVLEYPVGEHPTSSSVHRGPDGGAMWSGLGCALIARKTFEKLDPIEPWFRCDQQIQMTRLGTKGDVKLKKTDQPYEYGGQDVTFCLRLLEAGLAIAVVDPAEMRAGHAKLRSWGKQHTNHGTHSVEVLDEIERAG